MDFSRFMEKASRILAPIGIGAIVIMMTIVVINVLGRAIINTPLKGTVEMVEMLGVIMVSFIIAYTQYKKRNIIVGIVADRMPPRMRAIVDSFTMLVSLAVVACIVWATAVVDGAISGNFGWLGRLGFDFGDDDGFMFGAGLSFNMGPKAELRTEYVIRDNIDSLQFNLYYHL